VIFSVPASSGDLHHEQLGQTIRVDGVNAGEAVIGFAGVTQDRCAYHTLIDTML
jgi:hypothetical protein